MFRIQTVRYKIHFINIFLNTGMVRFYLTEIFRPVIRLAFQRLLLIL
jgi:hypothetical protein